MEKVIDKPEIVKQFNEDIERSYGLLRRAPSWVETSTRLAWTLEAVRQAEKLIKRAHDYAEQLEVNRLPVAEHCQTRETIFDLIGHTGNLLKGCIEEMDAAFGANDRRLAQLKGAR